MTVASFLAKHISLVRARPIFAGAVYGIGMFLFMYGVVMPLSKVGPPRWIIGIPLLNNVLIHIFGVGIPSMYFAKRATL